MKSERLLSLDVLRGITIVGMILVNNPGTWESVYAPLRHAEWNGLTPTDLVFPFFMFIMGVSMSFALSRFDHHFSRSFITKLVRRTVILFLLGLFLSWFSLVCAGVEQPFSQIRILGVLQRLALAYFFGSLLDETEIEFPVFIDSPMQKFDPQHTKNVLTKFYPNVSKQVILFPLLKKELTEEEYQYIQPIVNKSYLINNEKDGSHFVEVKPENLFEEYNNSGYAN